MPRKAVFRPTLRGFCVLLLCAAAFVLIGTDAMLDYLRDHAIWFAVLLTALLCFVHWEVVQANLRSPARLAAQPLVIGLVAYVVAVCLWIAAMFVHFKRRD
jgi:hypothetical protein